MIIGVTAGLFIGAMPGFGSVNGVAIVLPLTFIVRHPLRLFYWLPFIMARCMGRGIIDFTWNTWRFDGCGDNL